MSVALPSGQAACFCGALSGDEGQPRGQGLNRGVPESFVFLYWLFVLSGKKSILLEFQGRVSVLKLEVPVNGKEILLFKSPFKGCVGDEKLGKDTRGIAARWRLSPTGNHAACQRLRIGIHALSRFLHACGSQPARV